MSNLIRNGSTCLLALMFAPGLLADEARQPSGAEAATPLSVAPLDHIEYPEDRPAWVGQSSNFDHDAHIITVVSGPSETREESLAELALMKRVAVSAYVSRIAGNPDIADTPNHVYPISDEDIDRELVIRRYSGEVIQGDMTKYEHAVELVFTEEKRQQIAAAFRDVEVRHRLGALGVLVLGGLITLICSSTLVGVFSRRIERRDRISL